MKWQTICRALKARPTKTRSFSAACEAATTIFQVRLEASGSVDISILILAL